MKISIIDKEKRLRKILEDAGSLAIAFSGGYDSSFLAKFAEMTLSANNVLLIHVKSVFSPSRDELAIAKFAKASHARIVNIRANPLSVEKIARNPNIRCYHCKKVLMKMVIKKAKEFGFAKIADGTNYDDLSEERPGFKASNELNIMHPLLDAELTKKDMIIISKTYGFELSFSPSSACLATRIPHGTRLTAKALRTADKAENILCEFSIVSPRVRIHNDLAVIEPHPESFGQILKHREKIVSKIKELGFKKVLLDIAGYKKILKSTAL